MGKTIKNIRKLIQIIIDGLLEIIYPRENYCIICKEKDCRGICNNCLNKIKSSSKHMQKYYKKDLDGNEIISYGHYGGPLKQLILKLKYYKNFTAGDILAELLEEYITDNIAYNDYIISYIPISKKSKEKRGFNQCEYIAKKISKDLGIDCVSTLIKVKDTKEQKKLKRFERLKNIKGAFGINKKVNIENCNIILIDDVTTTGATLLEAYDILKKFKVKRIKLLTLAKSHI